MKNKITRTYKKNRHKQYNGKIEYMLNHRGEAKTRTSKNEYLHAAVIEVDQPSYRFDKNDEKVPYQLQYTKVIWSSTPIAESKALSEIGYRNSYNPHDSANERAAGKKALAEKIKKARAARYFIITNYQVAPDKNGTHKKWQRSMSIIEEISNRDIAAEVKRITTPEAAKQLMQDAKKSLTIADHERGNLIHAAKWAGRKILYCRWRMMTIEEHRRPEQLIMPDILQ